MCVWWVSSSVDRDLMITPLKFNGVMSLSYVCACACGLLGVCVRTRLVQRHSMTRDLIRFNRKTAVMLMTTANPCIVTQT